MPQAAPRHAARRSGRHPRPAAGCTRCEIQPGLDRSHLPDRSEHPASAAPERPAGVARLRVYAGARYARPAVTASAISPSDVTSDGLTSGRRAARAPSSGGTSMTPASSITMRIDEDRRDDRQIARAWRPGTGAARWSRAARARRRRRRRRATRSRTAVALVGRHEREQQHLPRAAASSRDRRRTAPA